MDRKQGKPNNNKHDNKDKNQYFERNNKSENLNSIIKQTQDKHMEIALAMSTADEKEENMRMDFQESDSYRADHNFSNDLVLEVERLTLMNKKYENELVIMRENNDMRIEIELDNINIQKRIHHQIKVCMNDFELKPYKEAIFCIKLWRDCYDALMVPRKKLDHIFDDESDLEVNMTSLIILELCDFLKKVDKECKSSFLSHIRPHIKVISRICSELSTRYLFDSNKHIVDLTVDSLHPVFLRQFERVQIRGDGNCLWNSISFAMFGDYSKMESLRLLTAATLIQYEDYFVGHLNEQMNKFGYRHGLTYEQLIDASLELSVWGDEYHLLALSLALHRPIVSYGSFAHISNLREDMSYEEMKTEYEKEDQINHMLYVGDSDDKHEYPICIYYNGENHYCAILPRNTDVSPPIPKTQLFQTVQEFSKADTTSSLNSQRYMNSRADENLKRNGSRFSEKNDKKFDSKEGRSITRNEIRETKPK